MFIRPHPDLSASQAKSVAAKLAAALDTDRLDPDRDGVYAVPLAEVPALAAALASAGLTDSDVLATDAPPDAEPPADPSIAALGDVGLSPDQVAAVVEELGIDPVAEAP